MRGGDGRDKSFGFDVCGDVLDVSTYGIGSFKELSDALVERRGGTTIELGNEDDAVILVRVDADDLSADNFIFSDGMSIV